MMKRVIALVVILSSLVFAGCTGNPKANEFVSDITKETASTEKIREEMWQKVYDAYNLLESIKKPTPENTDKIEKSLKNLVEYKDYDMNDKEFALLMSLMAMFYSKVTILKEMATGHPDTEITSNAKDIYQINKFIVERLLGI